MSPPGIKRLEPPDILLPERRSFLAILCVFILWMYAPLTCLCQARRERGRSCPLSIFPDVLLLSVSKAAKPLAVSWRTDYPHRGLMFYVLHDIDDSHTLFCAAASSSNACALHICPACPSLVRSIVRVCAHLAIRRFRRGCSRSMSAPHREGARSVSGAAFDRSRGPRGDQLSIQLHCPSIFCAY